MSENTSWRRFRGCFLKYSPRQKVPMGYNKLRASNGHLRRTLIARLKATGNNVCWICGKPINMDLKYPDPMSWSCDEYIPVSLGGSGMEFSNLREAHLVCNERRGNKLPQEIKSMKRREIKKSNKL